MSKRDTIANVKYKELFLPTLLIAMALNAASVVDTIFIAQLIGENAVSAVEIVEPIVLIVTIIELLFGLGGQILSLEAKAEFDELASNKYFTLSVVGTFILSLVLCVVFFLTRGYLATLLHPPAETAQYLGQYLSVLFFVFPVSCTLGVLCEFIRIDGQPNFASVLIIIANALNVVFDYIFIVFFHMGIEGPALATLLGYAVALLISVKYHHDPKRTYHYVIHKMHIKESLRDFAEICKIGFPDASITVYEIIVVTIFNTLLGIYMGSIGLNSYAVCMDVLLIASIIIMGLIETFTTIIPVYYTQHDYKNITYLYNKTAKYALVFSVAFTAILLLAPDLFLMLYKYNVSANASQYRFALRLFAITIIPSVHATIYIMYFEAIERPGFSGLLSAVCMFIGPLLSVFLFTPVIGIDNSIWIAFGFANILTIIISVVGVKIIERRENEYTGLLLYEKDLIPVTENFNMYSKGDEGSVMNHLISLNADETQCRDVQAVFDYIFDYNNDDIIVEALVIDYEDRISINIKDDGKSGYFEDIKKELSNPESFKSIGVLGFNNMEYSISK